MKLWLDNHLAPALCPWLEQTFRVEAVAVRTLGFSTADDPEIFAARLSGALDLLDAGERLVEISGPS